jgi:hypothetical protein
MQVSIHEVEDEVDVPVVFGADHVLEADDVLVAVQFLQEDDLAERPLGVCCVLERVEVLLKRHDVFSLLINCFPNNTISSLA